MVLPITKHENEIVEAVKNNPFVIITAETGSGKSTQVAKYLSKHFDKIIVTEPRVIAAKTLAMRVSEEMNKELGEEVGYMTAYDKCYSKDSKILYCTDGLQLVRTLFSKEEKIKRVLVIDEVHEWNINIECLIAWCKYMKDEWNTKVVIMSATLDTDGLSNFFGEGTKVLSIPGSMYDVKVEKRDKDDLIPLVKTFIARGKDIIVFVSGKKEIKSIMEELEDEDATVLPLHSEIEWNQQKKCFEKYDNSKVIVSTNIAQTSVTPDVDVVIDTGKAKISIENNGVQGLYEVDISIADIMQRKGRAGRTKEGMYFLCSNVSIEDRAEYTKPEIQRSILDRTVLQLASVGIDAEKLEFYHQPDKSAIKAAKLELEILGAVSGNEVTSLGYKMVKIPLSVQYSRMIIEAEKYGVTDQVITIAAILEIGGLLTKDGTYGKFTRECRSDLLAELDVWNVINSQRVDFQKFGINKKNFFKIKDTISKIKETLYGIIDIRANNDRDAILNSCISGLISHVFEERGWYDPKLISRDGEEFKLHRGSCIIGGGADYVVGKPMSFEVNGRYGMKFTMNIVTFATNIDEDIILDNIPAEYIEKKEFTSYNSEKDAVEVLTNMSFGCVDLGSEKRYVKDHPKYDELKAKYEEERASLRDYNVYCVEPPKESITIDGKDFEVNRLFDGRKYVELDTQTIFTTKVNDASLESGEKIWFSEDGNYDIQFQPNITALRNILENKYILLHKNYQNIEIERLPADTIENVLLNLDKLGKTFLTKDCGGYGENSIYIYVYLMLNKNTVSFRIGDDEDIANSNTKEALQNLLIKYVQKHYGNSKFSNTKSSSSKKPLNDEERKIKENFDSFVREILMDLKAENLKESMDFIEEYYTDLIKERK